MVFRWGDRILELRPDAQGRSVSVFHGSKETKRKERAPEMELVFWPAEGSRAVHGVEGIEPRSWRNRDLTAEARLEHGQFHLWVEGRLLACEPVPAGNEAFFLDVESGGKVATGEKVALPADSRFQVVSLRPLVNGQTSILEKDGVPFLYYDHGKSRLSLANAGWPEWRRDPGSFTEAYDGGVYFIGDDRVPLFQVPKADYSAVYLLAEADPDPRFTNWVTLRAGRRIPGSRLNSQVLMVDFGGEIPRRGKGLNVVRIPFTEAFAQDVEGPMIDLEVTKELRLARRAPDPNRFRWRPLGLPSGVKIAAITLERSPIQLEVKARQPGALFVQPEEPSYVVRLKNITKADQAYRLELKAGDQPGITLEGVLKPGKEQERVIPVAGLKPGYYPVVVTLSRENKPLLVRRTSLAVLPPDTRQYRAEAPWGTWDNYGEHFSPYPADLVGTIMQRLGLRYGMFNRPYQDRQRFGVVKGNHFKVGARKKEEQEAAEGYRKLKEEHPDLLPDALIFHEDSISGGHVTRIPDLFHDLPPYQLNETEEARFREMWKIAEETAVSLRKHYPDVKLHLGNGPMPLREEFLRRKFPSELFDTLGNENPSFSRIPESQPPDSIANNASLWMDRQLLDAYGYGDKKVWQAHETIYPSSNPGNLSYQTQADYFVRNVLHSMAWGMEPIRPGAIADVGNSYYHSNWGGNGFMTRRPEVAPKPAAVAMATLTLMLDGASYAGYLDPGSESAYFLRFAKKDGSTVCPFWVVRGEREFEVSVKGSGPVRLVSWDGVSTDMPLQDGHLNLRATSSPGWLVLPKGMTAEKVTLGEPRYPGSGPKGKVIVVDELSQLDGWLVADQPNPLLNYYNPLTPRRMGRFSFEVVKRHDGRDGIRVTPQKITHGKPTMPMYQELVRQTPLVLPGKPTEIGLWVHGNSGWGRIIVELEDASGQSWISIGARARGGSDWLADWVGKELAGSYKPGEIADWNTDDAWGLSRINFDGWRYVGIPLPGQYPGEGYHWPANSQWRWDKDGVVHYPLKLRKLVVELPEKVLYLNRFEPAKRPEIVLSNLVVAEADLDQPKREPGDYVPEAQITID